MDKNSPNQTALEKTAPKVSAASPFDDSYYARQYRSQSPWRKRGDRPVEFMTLIRIFRKEYSGASRILDIGCGEGHFICRARRWFDVAVGMDISEEGTRLTAAKSRGAAVRGDALNIPFASGCFDAVLALDLIEHLLAPEQFLREVHRVLRPGGVFIYSTPNPASWGARVKGNRWHGARDATHISIASIREWRGRTNTSGFQIIRDGTDVPWDVPYFATVPTWFQRLVLIGTKYILNLFDVVFPWTFGENYYCVARRLG